MTSRSIPIRNYSGDWEEKPRRLGMAGYIGSPLPLWEKLEPWPHFQTRVLANRKLPKAAIMAEDRWFPWYGEGEYFWMPPGWRHSWKAPLDPLERKRSQHSATPLYKYGRAQLVAKRTELDNEISLYRRVAKTGQQRKIVDLAVLGLGQGQIARRLKIDRTTVWRELKAMNESIEPKQTFPPSFLTFFDDADRALWVTERILGPNPSARDHLALVDGIKAAMIEAAAHPGKSVEVKGG